MVDDFEDERTLLETAGGRARDPLVDRARFRIRELVMARPGRVFYSRQLEVMLEREFFHWITNRAVREMV